MCTPLRPPHEELIGKPPDFPKVLYHERLLRGAAILNRPDFRRDFRPAFTSGKYGGSIVDTNEYVSSQGISFDFYPKEIGNVFEIKLTSSVYNYSGVRINIADNRLNLITGRSGVGKSTFLREYLPQYFERYAYINQKPLVGNANSNVATALDIFGNIIDVFAKQFKKDKLFFSNHTGSEGACPFCRGAGRIAYGNDFQNAAEIECKECAGTGFNQRLKLLKISGTSIFDIWKMTVDEGCGAFSSVDDIMPLSGSEALPG